MQNLSPNDRICLAKGDLIGGKNGPRILQAYRNLGLNPVPSNADQPIVKFSKHWTKPLRERDVEWWPRSYSAIQLMCGQPWGLIVVDCDGPIDLDLLNGPTPIPVTWQVKSRRGKHYWFRCQESVSCKRIWINGEGVKHKHIEIIGDRHLIYAPPSIRNEFQYRWIVSPLDVRLPAFMPQWMQALPNLAPEPPRKRNFSHRPRFEYENQDRLGEAIAHGLQIASQPSTSGWVKCYSITRKESNPSASFCVENGVLVDHGYCPRLVMGWPEVLETLKTGAIV